MPTLHSHTHCQAAPSNAHTQAWQRVWLSKCSTETTEKQADEKEARLPNSGFAKKRVQWLIEHSISHQLLCWVDSFVLRNPLLRKAANCWQQAFYSSSRTGKKPLSPNDLMILLNK